MNASRLLSPQEARNRVQTETDEILQCIDNKMNEMLTEMETLEKEYISKQQRKQNRINKLNLLITQTEDLVDDNILEVLVQNRLKDLQNELSIASIQESDCSVEFEWGFSRDVISKINSITLKRFDTDKDEGRAPRKGPRKADFNTDEGLPGSPPARSSNNYVSDTTNPILNVVSSAVGSDLIMEQLETVEQTEHGDFRGGHNLNRESIGIGCFNKPGSLNSESNVVSQERNSILETGGTDKTKVSFCRGPRKHPGLSKESTEFNSRKNECTSVNKQADCDSIAAQSELPDNDIEDVLHFVPENRRDRNRNSSQREIPRTSRMPYPRNSDDTDSRRFGRSTDTNRDGFGGPTDSNRDGFERRTDSNRSGFERRTDSNRDGFERRTDSNRNGFERRTYTNRGGSGGRTDSNRDGFGGRTDSNRDGFGGRTDSNRGGFEGRTDSNRDGFGGRTDSNRGGFEGRTYTNRGGFGGRTDSNRDGFGGHTDSNRDGFGGRTDSNRGGFEGRTYTNRGGFGGRTDSNRGGFGGRTDSNRDGFEGRTDSNRDGSGGRTDSNRGGFEGRTYTNRGGFGGRTDSNRGGFGGRTDSNRDGFEGRTDSNRDGSGARTDSNRGGFGGRTDSNRDGSGGRTDSNRGGFGGRTEMW